jgi:uncharacterized membrane protein YebE (DUF533 family)
MLFRFGALVMLADSKTTDFEKAWLENLASALGLGEARRQTLEQEICEASS